MVTETRNVKLSGSFQVRGNEPYKQWLQCFTDFCQQYRGEVTPEHLHLLYSNAELMFNKKGELDRVLYNSKSPMLPASVAREWATWLFGRLDICGSLSSIRCFKGRFGDNDRVTVHEFMSSDLPGLIHLRIGTTCANANYQESDKRR